MGAERDLSHFSGIVGLESTRDAVATIGSVDTATHSRADSHAMPQAGLVNPEKADAWARGLLAASAVLFLTTLPADRYVGGNSPYLALGAGYYVFWLGICAKIMATDPAAKAAFTEIQETQTLQQNEPLV